MSAETLDTFLSNAYRHEHFKKFIIESFGEDIGIKTEQQSLYDKHNSIITSYSQMCENIHLDSQELGIYAFKTQSINAKITLHKEIADILKNQPINAILAVFYDDKSTEFRLSLVTKGFDFAQNKTTFSNLRRSSFTLGENTKIKTAKNQLETFLNKKDKKLEHLQEAFSVEPVTKEFYNKYKKLYEDLSEKLCENKAVFNVLQGYEGLNEEKAINAFVKKLLGRIVFLYFLQKKGWLGVAQNASYGSGDKNFLLSIFNKAKQSNESFYEKYLCPLFFETLNTERKNDYSPNFDCKIPFLNGGLFEEAKNKQGKSIERDFVLTQSLGNTDFEAIFEVFESYNFTIEESTPDNQEVGIDPEMLGKVFESLIDYDRRKSSGAYYTPREIVHFMCKNILTRTLQEKISKDETNPQDAQNKAESQLPQAHKDSLYNFIFYKQSDDFIQSHATQLAHIITSLKILDPAIGSGAFPMGMLSEILESLHTLEPSMQKQNLAKLKREIIEKQIYGIDIDADAIEIAKLRFWLSIAVDEDTPSPLPNLDFKFMQGNSLIETLDGFELLPDEIDNILEAPSTRDSLFTKKELNLPKDLLDFINENSNLMTYIKDYFKEYKNDKNQLKDKIKSIFSHILSMQIDAKIQDMRKKYERIKDVELKKESHNECKNLITLIESKDMNKSENLDEILQVTKHIYENKIATQKQTKDILKEIVKLDIQIKNAQDFKEQFLQNDFHTDLLFLYKVFFYDVLKQGGFDLVIGNPPYIRQEGIKDSKPQLKMAFDTFRCKDKVYKIYGGSADIYTYFYAKGLSLLKNGGFLSFITSNKWCRAGYGKNIREFMLDVCIDSHIDCNGVKIFENATVDTAITTLQALPSTLEHTLVFCAIKDCKDKNIHEYIDKTQTHLHQNTLNAENFTFASKEELALKAKIESIGTPLKDWDINIYRGILTGYNEAFIISTEKRREILSACDDSEESLKPYPLSEYDQNLALD